MILDIAQVTSWFPLSEICAVFCPFLSVSPFYLPLIFKPDMIHNSFWSVFLNTLLEKALHTACAVKDLIHNTCHLVRYGANCLKTSAILQTEHVKRKTVTWRMINCELLYFSNSVLFAFNDFPDWEIEQQRLAKKEITLAVTKRNSLAGKIGRDHTCGQALSYKKACNQLLENPKPEQNVRKRSGNQGGLRELKEKQRFSNLLWRMLWFMSQHADLIATIKEKLDKALNYIQEIEGLKQKQSCLEERNMKLETSLEFAHSSITEVNKKIDAQDKAIKQLQGVKSLTKQVNEEKQRSVKLESHSCRNNLYFFNIPEEKDESFQTSENVLCRFIEVELN